MNHLDCFSGIGSWALAAKWMGWNTLAFVEKEPFCQQVLKKNFNGVPIHDDIFTFSALPFRGRIDILTGSTPCQPFSQAGKREGSNDARHLFPELLRVVAECQPEWVIIENVYGLLNIEGGQVFEAYNTSLESEGYSVQTLCIPASALNAPHRRDRLWIIAHHNGGGCNSEQYSSRHGQPNTTRGVIAHANSIGERTGCGEIQEANGEVSQWDDDAKSRNSEAELRCLALSSDRERLERGIRARLSAEHNRGQGKQWDENWVEVATEFCRVDDGGSVDLDGFKLTASKHRENRLKALGNGIIPQIAYEIFKAIDSSHKAQ